MKLKIGISIMRRNTLRNKNTGSHIMDATNEGAPLLGCVGQALERMESELEEEKRGRGCLVIVPQAVGGDLVVRIPPRGLSQFPLLALALEAVPDRQWEDGLREIHWSTGGDQEVSLLVGVTLFPVTEERFQEMLRVGYPVAPLQEPQAVSVVLTEIKLEQFQSSQVAVVEPPKVNVVSTWLKAGALALGSALLGAAAHSQYSKHEEA
jgi:hypothetical protein